ncbi:MAG: hypothetical protein PHR35_08245 [Kiritimatiellae bacterium]|nr:hypothetical protein [Kiritimatiellia bacterium]
MKLAWLASLFACAIALAEPEVKIRSTGGEVIEPSGQARLAVEMMFPLEERPLLAYRTRRDTQSNVYTPHPTTHLGFSRFGHMTYLYPAYRNCHQWSPPESVWSARRRGGGTVTQIVIPVFDGKETGRRVGAYSVRVAQVPAFKEWLFLRTTFEGALPERNEYVFAGTWTAFSERYAVRQGASRFAYAGERHFASYGDEKIPADLDFDGFAVYAVNSVLLDRDLNLVVFDPGQFESKTLDFYYFVKGFQLVTRPKKEEPIIAIACARYVTDTPRADAERFFREGRDKAVRRALACLDWEPEVEAGAAERLIEKALDTARAIPGVELKALDELIFLLRKAEYEGNHNAYFNSMDALKKINDDLTRAHIEAMLETVR